MNREIKFKSIVQYKDGKTESFYWEPFRVAKHLAKGLQYTGLKDNMEKEGYEGDIIERESPMKNIKKKVRGKIVFKKGCFKVEWKGPKDGNWNEVIEYHLPKSEIIGNIYENPELLK